MEIVRFLGLLLLGLFLHIAVTIVEIGHVFAIRAAIVFFFNFDFVDFLNKFKEEKGTNKTKQILNEDEEWLKTRGKY